MSTSDSQPRVAYELSFAPTKIHTVAAEKPLAAARPDPARDAWTGAAGGERRNGRQPWPLTPGHWKIASSVALAPGIGPETVLATGDRVLVQGRLLWQLFDGDGRALAQDRLRGGVTIDAERGCFYGGEPTGPLRAWKLADGALAYTVEPYFGATYERAHVARRGDELLIASIERPSDPHGRHTPSLTAIEVQSVPAKPETNRFGFLERTERLATLMMNSASLQIAGSEAGLAIAGVDTVYFTDARLEIGAALTADFEPLALSLDEQGRVCLAARHRSRSFLWLLERDGRRLVECELPPIATRLVSPPAIGYDRRIWLRVGDEITVVGADGRRLASTPVPRFAGLTVTADGWALVTEGATIVAMKPVERAGNPATIERHVLFTCPDGALLTPALLTASGQMLCASAKKLYRLSASLE